MQIDTMWFETMNNTDNKNREFGTPIMHNKVESANSIIDNEDNNDDKSDDNRTVDSDVFSKVDQDNVSRCIIYRDTVLDASDPTVIQLQHDSYEINTHTEFTFAPDEGQAPRTMSRDKDAEYLCFWTIFYGLRKPAISEHYVKWITFCW